MFARVMLVATAALAFTSPVRADGRDQAHEELRGLLKNVVAGLNGQNLDGVAPLFSDKVAITTVDQRLFKTFGDFKAYYDGLFHGDKARLKKITFNPVADDLTEFLTDDYGYVYGTSDDIYEFTDGDTRTMKSRWTALVAKQNGAWKITTVHTGVNIFDNPVLTALETYVAKSGLIGAIAGLIGGFLLARLLGGRRQAPLV
jgi:hypothetical protein